MAKQKTLKIIERSTILLEKEVIELLKQAKEHPRQTYNEIIKKMAGLFIDAKDKIKENKSFAEESKIKDHMEEKIIAE